MKLVVMSSHNPTVYQYTLDAGDSVEIVYKTTPSPGYYIKVNGTPDVAGDPNEFDAELYSLMLMEEYEDEGAVSSLSENGEFAIRSTNFDESEGTYDTPTAEE